MSLDPGSFFGRFQGFVFCCSAVSCDFVSMRWSEHVSSSSAVLSLPIECLSHMS